MDTRVFPPVERTLYNLDLVSWEPLPDKGLTHIIPCENLLVFAKEHEYHHRLVPTVYRSLVKAAHQRESATRMEPYMAYNKQRALVILAEPFPRLVGELHHDQFIMGLGEVGLHFLTSVSQNLIFE